MTKGRFTVWVLVSVLGVILIMGLLFAFAGAMIGVVAGVVVGLYSKWVLGIANPQTAWLFFLPALVSFLAGALYGAWIAVGLARSFGRIVRTAESRRQYI
jgi:ABC-type dipeptide/oligopeptide/nickel transport system permease subunit